MITLLKNFMTFAVKVKFLTMNFMKRTSQSYEKQSQAFFYP